jgi:hypothetical protein
MPTEEMGSRITPQPPNVATKVVVALVLAFLCFVAVTMVGLFYYIQVGAPDALKQAVESRFPSPALQRTPQADLKKFELEQRMALEGYAWIDQSKGLARIPITDAMKIIAARGDHAYDAPDRPARVPADSDPAGANP